MANKDPYEILGVSRSATQDEIKRAYRRLAKTHHPDHNPGDKSAERRFKEIQAAYEVLGDPQRREQFDRFGAGGPAPDVHTWGHGVPGGFEGVPLDFDSLGDLTSIFEQFFTRAGPRGGGRRARATRAEPAARGRDIEHEVELSFEEAARGTTREIRLSGGRGASERIEVHIPPGVDDGQRIRVAGRGQEGASGRGDLVLRCRVQPHAFFRRDGLDVLLHVPLSVSEATLGTRVTLPTLDGPAVVTVPPGTSSGTRLRLRGKGIRGPRGDRTGDLYAIVQIQVPKELSPRARTLLAELDGELHQRPREKLGWHKGE